MLADTELADTERTALPGKADRTLRRHADNSRWLQSARPRPPRRKLTDRPASECTAELHDAPKLADAELADPACELAASVSTRALSASVSTALPTATISATAISDALATATTALAAATHATAAVAPPAAVSISISIPISYTYPAGQIDSYHFDMFDFLHSYGMFDYTTQAQIEPRLMARGVALQVARAKRVDGSLAQHSFGDGSPRGRQGGGFSTPPSPPTTRAIFS